MLKMIFQEQDQKDERSSSEKIQWWFMLYCKGRTFDFFWKEEWDLEKAFCLEVYIWWIVSLQQIDFGRSDHLMLNLLTKSELRLQSERWDHFVLFCRLGSREIGKPRMYCFCIKAQPMGSSHWTFHMQPAICTLASQPTQRWYRRY